MARKLEVEIVGDVSSYKRAVHTANSETGKLGGKFSGLGKTAALAAGSAGVAALTTAVKIGIDEFTESSKVAAQTNAVLKSTGGVAGVTAGQVDKMATAIMKKSGIDDEAVKSGENLLLTFTNIRNETGKGNDIFNQATAVMADMSVALGQDMKSSAIQLGKALNDPIKGVTALQRVGVSFTKAQKEQIKALVDSGHSMEAQKLILRELNKEFGGSAEAMGKTLPGQINILKEQFNNLAGEGVAVAIAKLQELRPTIETIIGVIQDLMPVLKPLATLMIDVFVTPMKVIFDLIRGDWTQAWDDFKKPVQDAVAFVTNIWKLLAPAFQAAISAIQSAATTAWNAISTLTTNVWNTIKSTLTTIWQGLQTAATTTWNAIKTTVTTVWTALQTAATTAWNAIKTTITTVTTGIQTALTTAWNTIKTNVTTAWNAIKTLATTVWAAIKTAITTPIDAAKTAVTTAVNAIRSTVTSVFNAVQSAVSGIWNRIQSAISGAINAAKGVVVGAVNAIKGALNDAFHAMSGVAGKLKSLIISPINTVISALNSIRIPGFHVHIPGFKGPFGVGWGGADIGWHGLTPFNIPSLAEGGIALGPTMALIGEAGPEAIVPLDRAAGDVTSGVHIHFHGGTFVGTSAPQVADIIYRELVRKSSRNAGNLGLA